MTTPVCTARHDDFPIPPADQADLSRFQEDGLSLDNVTLGKLVGAAFDGCGQCQVTQLAILQTDPLTVTRLIELAAIAIAQEVGGIPPSMITGTGPSTVSDPFRTVITAGLDEQHVQMLAAVRGLSDTQRRQAAEDALDLLTGTLAITSQIAVQKGQS